VPYVISDFEYDGQVPVDAFVATDDYLTGIGMSRVRARRALFRGYPASITAACDNELGQFGQIQFALA
jgi:hypothetical protein